MTTRIHICAHRNWWHVKLRENWEYRDLLRMLIRHDLTAGTDYYPGSEACSATHQTWQHGIRRAEALTGG